MVRRMWMVWTDDVEQMFSEVLWSSMDDAQKTSFMSEHQGKFSGRFPAAVIDGVFYQGLVDVAKKFMADGLVTAPKK